MRHGFSAKALGRATGLGYRAIRYRMQKHGLRMKPLYDWFSLDDWARVFAAHNSLTEVAESLGVSCSALSRSLRERGIRHPYKNTNEGHSLLSDVETEDLWTLYRRERYSIQAVASVFGMSDGAVRNEFKRRGLEIRPRKRGAGGRFVRKDAP